ncbi:GrpB family protein [Bacillus hwajinpoensis]|uniref:GrpB family protein n=1 Tax=Guptibacillus hwajinpoensis TaxID=208199 RepID=A0A845F0J5_9BACL|nr:GrpB family protein [Pseudalkalibacillus hwajinpoensis]MYL64288.1 GrpB family protein [Pseudalkalibacillus hwajinpoensis]
MAKSIVNLIEYNTDWESQFDYEKKRIIAAIGDKIVGIEHIGSTSIKGLKAKPVIDILVGIKDLNSTSAFVQPLSEVEFEYVPKPELTDRRFFRKGLWGKGTAHLHICKIHSTEWVEKIMFRDYLRKHPKIAEEYALLKSELATKYNYDRSAYTQQKEPFIKEIIRKAKREL